MENEIIKELDSLDLSSKNSKPVQHAEKDSASYEHQQQQPPSTSDSNSDGHEALSRINNNNSSNRSTSSSRKDSVIFDLVPEESMLKHTKGFIKNSNLPRDQSNSSSQSAKSRISSLQSQHSSKINNKIPHNMGSTGPDADSQVTLPQRFVVKYLGFRETNGLWGIRYTRRPVDEMVASAKKVLSENTERSLALLKVEVSEDGILVGPMPQNQNPNFPSGRFAIESISYGVQDLVYTRVFAMIVVKSEGSVRVAATSQNLSQDNSPVSQQTSDGSQPFRCHAFVCDSRNTARHLTYSLATAFQKFSENVASGKIKLQKPKRFAIDLRNPQDIEQELIDETEA